MVLRQWAANISRMVQTKKSHGKWLVHNHIIVLLAKIWIKINAIFILVTLNKEFVTLTAVSSLTYRPETDIISSKWQVTQWHRHSMELCSIFYSCPCAAVKCHWFLQHTAHSSQHNIWMLQINTTPVWIMNQNVPHINFMFHIVPYHLRNDFN